MFAFLAGCDLKATLGLADGLSIKKQMAKAAQMP